MYIMHHCVLYDIVKQNGLVGNILGGPLHSVVIVEVVIIHKNISRMPCAVSPWYTVVTYLIHPYFPFVDVLTFTKVGAVNHTFVYTDIRLIWLIAAKKRLFLQDTVVLHECLIEQHMWRGVRHTSCAKSVISIPLR